VDGHGDAPPKAGQTYLKFAALLSQSKVEKGDAAKMCATSCTEFALKI